MSEIERIERRLSLHDLRVLMSVIQAGSMGKAARRLATSQPAISRSIAELESALGVRLLDRTSQGIEPTEYGRALLRRGISVFDELTQGIKDIAIPCRSNRRGTENWSFDCNRCWICLDRNQSPVSAVSRPQLPGSFHGYRNGIPCAVGSPSRCGSCARHRAASRGTLGCRTASTRPACGRGGEATSTAPAPWLKTWRFDGRALDAADI